MCMWTDVRTTKSGGSITVWTANAHSWYWDTGTSSWVYCVVNTWGQDWNGFIYN